ncbi:MAG: transposase [Pseudobacteriovorax sp.]|nr:transposase [Pseudobacteriovorax sp.]
MANHSKLSDSEKYELIMKLLRKEATASELSRQYQVSEPTIGRWRDDFLDGGKQRLSVRRNKENSSELKRLKVELAEHKQLIGEYAFANDFLKKRLDSSI